MESVALTLFGRFLFGIGGESFGICINALLIFWFKEKELAFSQVFNLVRSDDNLFSIGNKSECWKSSKRSYLFFKSTSRKICIDSLFYHQFIKSGG